MKFLYVVDMRHDYTAESRFAVAKDLDQAAEKAHEFFESYDFEIKDGKPFDPGHDDGAEGGFICFDGVKMRKGKVLEFQHANGSGPVCRVSKADNPFN